MALTALRRRSRCGLGGFRFEKGGQTRISGLSLCGPILPSSRALQACDYVIPRIELTERWRSSAIQRTEHATAAPIQDVRIDHRGADVAVSEQLLDGANVIALLEKV